MVGSTLLSIPWGFRQSGIVLGCIVFFLIAFISYYTCTLVVRHSKNMKQFKLLFGVTLDDGKKKNHQSSVNRSEADVDENDEKMVVNDIAEEEETNRLLTKNDTELENGVEEEEEIHDFSEICVVALGRWSRFVSISTSILILIGGSIAYHILMRDCLLSIVYGISGLTENKKFPWQKGGPPWYWNDIVASLAIVAVAFPLSLFKDLKLLGKINSLGVFFVMGLLSFIVYACTRGFIDPYWTLHNSQKNQTMIATAASLSSGFDLELMMDSIEWSSILFGNGTNPDHPKLVNQLQLFSINFSHLLAILSLSFFIHSVIVSILKNQKSLKHTTRDSAIAFMMAGMCYFIPGVLGSVAFRYVPTDSIQQNFLNQFSNKDIIANIARSSVLLQLIGIYPLLLYVIRVQLFEATMNKTYPGFILTFILNLFCCLSTTLFACFYPNVGTVLTYVGAICGLVYLFILPIGVHLSVMRKLGQLRWYSVIFHISLVIFGASILVLQFIPFEKIIKK